MDGEKDEAQQEQAPPMRADARRNVDALLRAALAVFGRLGVDAPMRTIAAEAGVGVGTLYRHFPQRSDLIKAIIQHEVDDCAAAASRLAATEPPAAALSAWVQRLVDFVGTKRGLGPALHSGDAAYQALPTYVLDRLTPALSGLLDAAAAAGEIRADTDARALLLATMRLAAPASHGDTAEARAMVALLVDGLRYGGAAATGPRAP